MDSSRDKEAGGTDYRSNNAFFSSVDRTSCRGTSWWWVMLTSKSASAYSSNLKSPAIEVMTYRRQPKRDQQGRALCRLVRGRRSRRTFRAGGDMASEKMMIPLRIFLSSKIPMNLIKQSQRVVQL